MKLDKRTLLILAGVVAVGAVLWGIGARRQAQDASQKAKKLYGLAV
jgi:hypothetical protein